MIGTRTAAWAPCPGIAAAVVIDEHDEALQSESSPTWHARDVVVERCRRAEVPVVVGVTVPDGHRPALATGGPTARVARARRLADPRRRRPIGPGTVAALVADVDVDRPPPRSRPPGGLRDQHDRTGAAPGVSPVPRPRPLRALRGRRRTGGPPAYWCAAGAARPDRRCASSAGRRRSPTCGRG